MIIKRENYLLHIRKFYDSNLIKVLTGIRRCGKSVILEQIMDEISSSGKADRKHCIFVNFEDMTFSNLTTAKKLNRYLLKKMVDDKKYFIFLDEIQHVKQFEKVLSSLKATKNVSIFVTGSNSKLLSGRLASLLVGRCKEFKIRPFSYQEYLAYFKENSIEAPKKALNDYLRFGGMPQRLDYESEEDIVDYLKSVYLGILDKDICTPKSKIDKETFTAVSSYVLANASKEFSANSIVDFYNRSNPDTIYRETIYRYLEKMEQACLISRVKRYDVSSKRTLKAIEKQFAVDNGFLLACANGNQIQLSRCLENAVYNELLSRGYEVKIGKTYKGEIDFVVMKDGKKCFLQVAYMLSNDEVISREFDAFKSVKDPSPKYVMSLDEFDMSKEGIIHLNIEEWLLGKTTLFLS